MGSLVRRQLRRDAPAQTVNEASDCDRRTRGLGLQSGWILKGLRRRQMFVGPPQPIGREEEEDERQDLVESALSQFWRRRRHRSIPGDTISWPMRVRESDLSGKRVHRDISLGFSF